MATRDDEVAWNASSGSSSSDDDDDDDETEDGGAPPSHSGGLQCNSSSSSSSFVAKAIFHTASGEPLMQIEATNDGWKEAIQQKYHILEAQSRTYPVEEDEENLGDGTNTGTGTEQKKTHKNHTAVKAAAAAATGSAVAAGGTSMAVGALGYTATGIAANSAAASIMAAEAVATTGGGGVMAGGITATLQSMGMVGVMASPVGMGLAAAGAFGGAALYYGIHKRNNTHKTRKQKKEEIETKRLEMVQHLAAALADESAREMEREQQQQYTAAIDDASAPSDIPYEQLLGNDDYDDDDDDDDEQHRDRLDSGCWTVVLAKDIRESHADDGSDYAFTHTVCMDPLEAEIEFLQHPVSSKESTSSIVAKALVHPNGHVVELQVKSTLPNDSHDDDDKGWETALSLHYSFLRQQGVIEEALAAFRASSNGCGMDTSIALQTPLLEKELASAARL